MIFLLYNIFQTEAIMKINFNEMTEQTIPNFLGGNGNYNVKMYVDGEGNKMMVGRLAPGSSLGLHKHVINAEAIYVLSGEGVMHTDEGDEYLKAGECTFCPKGHEHSFENQSEKDLVFFGAVIK
jgi:hypothetical protein